MSPLLLFMSCLMTTIEEGEEYPGGETTNTFLGGNNAFILPAENILVENEIHFYSGNSFFNQPWVEHPASTQSRDGLGPLYNARSCAACHFKDGRAEPPDWFYKSELKMEMSSMPSRGMVYNYKTLVFKTFPWKELQLFNMKNPPILSAMVHPTRSSNHTMRFQVYNMGLYQQILSSPHGLPLQ